MLRNLINRLLRSLLVPMPANVLKPVAHRMVTSSLQLQVRKMK